MNCLFIDNSKKADVQSQYESYLKQYWSQLEQQNNKQYRHYSIANQVKIKLSKRARSVQQKEKLKKQNLNAAMLALKQQTPQARNFMIRYADIVKPHTQKNQDRDKEKSLMFNI